MGGNLQAKDSGGRNIAADNQPHYRRLHLQLVQQFQGKEVSPGIQQKLSDALELLQVQDARGLLLVRSARRSGVPRVIELREVTGCRKSHRDLG